MAMIPFVKMHGIGNDYVYVDAVARPEIAERPTAELGELARRISDRHRGVGSDGLILVCRPTAEGLAQHAQVRMRMFNADGSESEMCGNGVRCVAKFAHDRLGVTANPMLVETGRGVLKIGYQANGHNKLTTAVVDMGRPILVAREVPTTLAPNHASGGVVGAPWKAAEALYVQGLDPRVTAVSMGNPHAVMFVKDVGGVELDRIGPVLERDSAFPQRVNVHIVQTLRSTPPMAELRMRTWERGAGLTQACGTGACAVLVAAVLNGASGRRATVHLPGGSLSIYWDEASGNVLMTGPAADVFEGVWPE